MITSIELKNFKGHQDSKIELDPEQRICCLVGPNGSGKSSFLHAVDLVAQLFLRPFEEVLSGGSATELIRSGASFFEIILEGRPSIEEETTTSSIDKPSVKFWKYSVRVENNPKTGIKSTWKESQFINQRKDPLEKKGILFEAKPKKDEGGLESKNEKTGSEASEVKNFPELCDELANSIFVSPEITYLRESANIVAVDPLPFGSGEGLADVLAAWAAGQSERLDKLTELAHKVIPTLEKIRVRRVLKQIDDKEYIQHQLMVDMCTGKSIPSTQVSTGTVLTISILAHLVALDEIPKVLLLDDVERGLHPAAQQEFMRSLVEILKQLQNLQVIVSSHSPFIVDEIPLNCTWVFAVDTKSGQVAVNNLSAAPDVDEEADEGEKLSNGGIWLINGENWVLGKK